MAPLLLIVLMPAGFVGSAWVTNSIFDYFRRDAEQITNMDRLGTFILLLSIFSSYCYFICHFIEK